AAPPRLVPRSRLFASLISQCDVPVPGASISDRPGVGKSRSRRGGQEADPPRGATLIRHSRRENLSGGVGEGYGLSIGWPRAAPGRQVHGARSEERRVV